MTHEERIALLKSHPDETLSPALLARIIGGNPYAYTLAAKEGKLTLPYIWRGRNLRVFRVPMLRLLEVGGTVTAFDD